MEKLAQGTLVTHLRSAARKEVQSLKEWQYMKIPQK